MTSITMMVSSISTTPSWINPGDMNEWLKKNNGYTDEDTFVWNSIMPLGLAYGGLDPFVDRLRFHLIAGRPVVANVMNGAHWVYVTGYGNGYFTVYDPKYDKLVYNTGEVHLYAWYSTTSAPVLFDSRPTSDA